MQVPGRSLWVQLRHQIAKHAMLALGQVLQLRDAQVVMLALGPQSQVLHLLPLVFRVMLEPMHQRPRRLVRIVTQGHGHLVLELPSLPVWKTLM